MVQKAQPPKHPRWMLTENLIMSYAGIRFPLYFGVGKTGVRKVERHIQLALSHGRIGGIDHHYLLSGLLENACGGILVGLFFDVTEAFVPASSCLSGILRERTDAGLLLLPEIHFP